MLDEDKAYEELVKAYEEHKLYKEQLEAANRSRKEMAEAKAVAAIDELRRAGVNITINAVSKRSGCSRSFLRNSSVVKEAIAEANSKMISEGGKDVKIKMLSAENRKLKSELSRLKNSINTNSKLIAELRALEVKYEKLKREHEVLLNKFYRSI